MKNINLLIKRIIDILGSGIGLLFTSPLLLFASLMIKISMPGPTFFIQERVGKDKKTFKVIKFRTMKVDKEAERNMDTSRDSERLTYAGKILRRTKIDEIPQLLNVFKGEMSLIGPRPTFMRHVEEYTEYELQRLKMKPGMTGLAQVNGGTCLPWKTRIEYDIDYINNYNLLLDFKILLKTLTVIFKGEESQLKEGKKEGIKKNV